VRIGVIGAGNIGGNAARRLAGAGHEVLLSFSRDPTSLEVLARELGERARTGTPAEAVAFGEAVIFAVPWGAIPEALEQAGDLSGRIVVDTTNQFGPAPKPAEGQTAAAFNAARMPGASYTKSFNTLTAAFQAAAAERTGPDRVVQWLCGVEEGAKQVVSGLITDAGYVPVDLGGVETCAVMEAPRRPGAVYGEEYRLADAQAVAAAVREGRPIPPTPSYA